MQRLPILLILLFSSQLAFAHGQLTEQIAAVTRAIDAEPGNAQHYWQRGELFHQHREFAHAAADFERALRLQPTLVAVHLSQTKLLLDWGKPDAALAAVGRFLEQEPEHVDAHWQRAHALAGIGKFDAALRDMDFAIAHAVTARPDHYLERAQFLMRRGARADIDLAIAGLDDGMQRVGIIASLQLYAIELEARRGEPDAALHRLDQLLPQYRRKETLLAKRGDILLANQRNSEAQAAYAAALNAIDSLPLRLRGSQAMLELRTHIEQGKSR